MGRTPFLTIPKQFYLAALRDLKEDLGLKIKHEAWQVAKVSEDFQPNLENL